MLKIITLTLAAASAAPVAADPHGCDLDLDDNRRAGVARELVRTADGHRLELRSDSHPDITADTRGRLRVDGNPYRLSADTEAEVAEYVKAHIRLRDQAAAVGTEAANLGAGAAGRALAAVRLGTTDEPENDLERETGRIEERAGDLCETARRLRRLERRLATQVPELKPYAADWSGNDFTI